METNVLWRPYEKHRKPIVGVDSDVPGRVVTVTGGGGAETTPTRLVDLGASGNSRTALSPFFDGISAQSLSSAGALTGSDETATTDPFAPACFQEDCLVTHGFRWRNGVLMGLGSLAGPRFSSIASWINGNGVIVGLSQNGKINPLIPDLPELRAVLWETSKIADLGTLPGGSHSGAFAVNNAGQVVGFSTNAISDPNPSLLTETIGDRVTQVQKRGFWGCRRKSAETPVFMRVGRRFCPQLEPHFGFVSKNDSLWGANDADYRTVLARQGGD